MYFSDSSLEMLRGPDGQLPEKLRHLEPHLLERIIYEIMDTDLNVCWDDIGNIIRFIKKLTYSSLVDLFKSSSISN